MRVIWVIVIIRWHDYYVRWGLGTDQGKVRVPLPSEANFGGMRGFLRNGKKHMNLRGNDVGCMKLTQANNIRKFLQILRRYRRGTRRTE